VPFGALSGVHLVMFAARVSAHDPDCFTSRRHAGPRREL